jgi:hypothetical protein
MPSSSAISDYPQRLACVLAFAAAVLLCPAPAAFAQLYATPITDPDKLYQMDGYSVAPPRGQGWFEMKRDRDHLYFGKRLSSPTHSLIAVALSAPTADAIDNVDAFRDFILQQLTENPTDPRNKILTATAEVDPAAGPFCVRYQTRSEDRGASNAGGKTLLAETFGVSCIHPEKKTLAIDVGYTERGLPGETGTALRDEGENFLRSLKFLPRP